MRFANYQRIIAGLTTAGILAIGGTSYAAGTASFSASGASVTNGGTATVAVYEDGTNVNAVTATYSFDSSKLQFVGVSCASAFPNSQSPSGSSVTCYASGGTAVSGSNEVATLSFKAIGTGAASVTVTGSQIASAGVNTWNGSTASTTVTVTAAPTPTPTPTPSSPAQTTIGSTNTGSRTTTVSSSNKASGSSNTPTSDNASSTSNNNDTKSTAGSVKGASITNKSGKTSGTVATTSTVKTSHVGLVTSTISIILLVAAGAYWFFFQKRTETIPAKTYKLDTNTTSKKATPAAKVKSTATKSTRAKK